MRPYNSKSTHEKFMKEFEKFLKHFNAKKYREMIALYIKTIGISHSLMKESKLNTTEDEVLTNLRRLITKYLPEMNASEKVQLVSFSFNEGLNSQLTRIEKINEIHNNLTTIKSYTAKRKPVMKVVPMMNVNSDQTEKGFEAETGKKIDTETQPEQLNDSQSVSNISTSDGSEMVTIKSVTSRGKRFKDDKASTKEDEIQDDTFSVNAKKRKQNKESLTKSDKSSLTNKKVQKANSQKKDVNIPKVKTDIEVNYQIETDEAKDSPIVFQKSKKPDYYFSHDFNARNDQKIQMLLSKYHYQGYGIFWVIVERLHEEGGRIIYDENFKKAFSYEIRKRVDWIDKFINYLISIQLIKQINNCFYSERVDKFLIKLKELSEKRKIAASFRGKTTKKESINSSKGDFLEGNDNQMLTKEKKENEIKEKEIEKKEIKREVVSETQQQQQFKKFDFSLIKEKFQVLNIIPELQLDDVVNNYLQFRNENQWRTTKGQPITDIDKDIKRWAEREKINHNQRKNGKSISYEEYEQKLDKLFGDKK